VLVDFRSGDDAGVYLLQEGLALVQTVDFFTPVVDDPEAYGAIAAANALSDVYAMGGRPLTALSIAAIPETDFPPEWAAAIFRGGLAKLREAVGVSRRTLERWRQWWMEEFTRTAFWRWAKGRLAVSVEKSRLPLSLLECFQKPTAEQKTIDLLRFILPLTSTSVIQET